MTEIRIQRNLVAILAADVVGYSRLVGVDELGTIEALKVHHESFVGPVVVSHNGRIFKTMGDGLLVEFSSAVDAIKCSIAIQQGMAKRNSMIPIDKRIIFRIGVNVGDIIIDGDDILGEGVIIASRLEALCEPGGVCVSRAMHDQIRDKLYLVFHDLGPHSVKNIARPIEVFSMGEQEILHLVKEDSYGQASATEGTARIDSENQTANQQVKFCKTFDGVQIAYATVGSGAPLVKAPNWMTHLEYEWESPVWRHWVRELSRKNTLVRFDQRGNGLSDWNVDEISFQAFVSDLETVVDTLELNQFPLIGISQGVAIAIAYAVRHPERVSQLILCGGFILGAAIRGNVDTERSEALNTLIRLGWGQDNPALRQMYTTNLIPDGTKEQMDWYNELMRVSTSPENALRLREAFSIMDVSDLLSQVTAPTLILHARNDAIAPFEDSRKMAAEIPNARFVALEGNNHILLENEPAWPRFVTELRSFLETTN